MEIGSSEYLTNILLRHYNLNARVIKYKNFAEISLAIMNKEIDFSIYIYPGIGSLKEILNSGIGDNSGIKNGIIDFYYESNSSFAVPIELKDFGLKIKPYFDMLCDDKEIIEWCRENYTNINTCHSCLGSKFTSKWPMERFSGNGIVHYEEK